METRGGAPVRYHPQHTLIDTLRMLQYVNSLLRIGITMLTLPLPATPCADPDIQQR